MIKFFETVRHGKYQEVTGKQKGDPFDMANCLIERLGCEDVLTYLIAIIGDEIACDALAEICQIFKIPYTGADVSSHKHESRRRRMKESYMDDDLNILRSIAAEDDGIARYVIHGVYYYCLVPYCTDCDTDDYRGDIMGCLEYTLHELIDSGHEDDVGIMGAFMHDFSDENPSYDELAEYELMDIDLGYCMYNLEYFEIIECPVGVPCYD